MTLAPVWAQGCAKHVKLDLPACSICGGNSGSLIDGAHALCTAYKARGMPTPSLGDACGCCKGQKGHPRSPVGPVNPSGRTMRQWFLTCTTCKGTGTIGSQMV